MKIKIPKIKKSYKKENFKINPNIYWKVVVILFLVTLIVIFFFAYDLFSKINKENNDMLNNNSTKIEKEKKEKINKVLDYFYEREKKSNDILNSPSAVVDPSL
jgi:hypothetical protein